jgi:CubicO group peptidase (beta-lactamase class C family)
MTVQDLLRHTAGLTYEFLDPSPVRQLYTEAKLYSRQRSNAEQVAEIARLPLAHEPGAVWDYSRATDVLGRLVEVLGGAPLGAVLKAQIFDPLGMVDTGFEVPAEQHHRLAEPLAAPPEGVRLLGRKTLEFMTADHLGPIPRDGDLLPPGHGFGLGFAVKTALGEHTEPGSVGSYGWSGAAGTAFFVDPAEAMFAIVMTQSPGLLDDVRELFRQGVYAALD